MNVFADKAIVGSESGKWPARQSDPVGASTEMLQQTARRRVIVMLLLALRSMVGASTAMVATVPLLLAASQGLEHQLRAQPERGDTTNGAPAPKSAHGCDCHGDSYRGGGGGNGVAISTGDSRLKSELLSLGLFNSELVDRLCDNNRFGVGGYDGGRDEQAKILAAVSLGEQSFSSKGTLHSAVSPTSKEWQGDGAVAGASSALAIEAEGEGQGKGEVEARAETEVVEPDLAADSPRRCREPQLARQMASREEARTPSSSLSSAQRERPERSERERSKRDFSRDNQESSVSPAAVARPPSDDRTNRKRLPRSSASKSSERVASNLPANSEAQAELLQLLAELYARARLAQQLEKKNQDNWQGVKMRPTNATMTSTNQEALNKWLRQRQEKFQALKNFTVEVIPEHPNRTINVCLDGPKILVLPDATDWLYCLTRDQWIDKLWADLPRLSSLHYPIIVLNILIFLFGTTGNIFVCLSVYRNHQLRSVTNYFIVNLAFADFLVILICLPATGVWDLSLTWFFGTVPCKLIMFLQDVSISVSVLTLTAISLDRYYAICHPLKFKSNLNQAKRIIVMIWVVSLMIMSPDLIYLSAKSSEELSEAGLDTVLYSDCNYNWSESSSKIFQFVKTILLYLIPCLLMIVAHSTIMRTLRAASSVCQDELKLMEQHHNRTGRNRISLDHGGCGQENGLTGEGGERAAAFMNSNKEAAKVGRQRRAASDFVIEFHLLPSSAKKRLLSRRASGSAGRRLSSSARERSTRPVSDLAKSKETTNQQNNDNNNNNNIELQRQIRFSETDANSFDDVTGCVQQQPVKGEFQREVAAGTNERISFGSGAGQLDELFEPRTGSLSSSTKLKMTMHNRNRLESREKAAKMLIAIAVIFAICYLPVHLINFLRQFMDTIPQTDMTSTISMLAHCICYLNSAINPIIYNHMNSIFRAEFKRFLSCLCWRKKPPNQTPTASIASTNQQLQNSKLPIANKANRLQQQQRHANEADEETVHLQQVKSSSLKAFDGKRPITTNNGLRAHKQSDLEPSSCLTTVIEFGL